MKDEQVYIQRIWFSVGPTAKKCGCEVGAVTEELKAPCRKHAPLVQCQTCGTWSLFMDIERDSDGGWICAQRGDCNRRYFMGMWAKGTRPK